MIFTAGLKSVCNICFYMTFANFIGVLAGGSNLFVTLPVFVLAAFLGAFLAERGRIKYLALAPLVLCFFMVPLHPANVLVLIPACIYTAFALLRPRQGMSHQEYLVVFKAFAKLFIPYLLAALLFGQLAAVENGSVLFAMTFLAGAVTLLRILRHDDEVINERRFKLLNVLYISGAIAIGPILSINDFFVLRTLGRLYTDIIVPAFVFLISGIFNLVNALLQSLYLWTPEEEAGEVVDMLEIFEAWEEAGAEIWARIVGYIVSVIIVLAVLLGAVLLVRHIVRKVKAMLAQAEQPPPSYSESRTTIGAVAAPSAQKRRRRQGNPVREIYRKFLNLCKRRDMDIQPFMTSQDIEQAAAEHFSQPQLKALRDIYIKVRYADADCTKEDIKQAKALYNELSKERDA
ncbi:MAG: DUF4129 domain-containing protein [Oscillospiraceae bacterium]|nr:DUF4129 domain-containing protein [Oscillospiraceae bacterium]